MTETKSFNSSPLWRGWILGLLACGIFAAVATRDVWPPMDGDSAMLFPAALELARGNGFVNTPWIPPLNDTIDGPGGRRYISHGFLNPLLVGLAAKFTGGDSQALVAWLYVVVLLAAVASSLGMVAYLYPTNERSPMVQAAFGFLSVTGMFSLAFMWFGRMEGMVMLWVGCGILALRFLPLVVGLFVAGAALGLMAWTSPVSGVIGGVALSIFMLIRAGAFSVPGVLSVVAGGALATAASLALYPYPLADWVGGTIRHSKIHFDHPAFQGIWHTWFARPQAPLLVATVLLVIAGAIGVLRAAVCKLPAWRKALVVGFVLLLALAMFRLTVVRGEAAYNMMPLIPVLAAMCAHNASSCARRVTIIIALMFPSLGLARTALLLASQVANGPRYEEVRAAVSERMPEGLLVSKGLWLAVPELGGVAYGRPGSSAVEPRWFIDQQMATGRAVPAEYSGYELVTDRFSGPVRLFGFPICRAPTGWQYALYEKIGAED